MVLVCVFFFFQAEDGIRDVAVTGVQTCALPISIAGAAGWRWALIVTAALSALSAFVVEPWRAEIDRERQPRTGGLLSELLSIRSAILPFRVIASRRSLLWLAGTGFCFACVQGCVFSFYVTDLNTALGM